MLSSFLRNLSITILCLLFYQSLYGATVKRVIKKKRIVVIDAGKNEGLSKGIKVCFLKENGKKVACGRVRKVRKKVSFVRVNKKRLRRVKKGMEATFTVKGVETEESATEIASSDSLSSKKTQIQVFYLITPMTPSKFQKLNYSEPVSGAETMWDPSGDIGSANLGFGANVTFSIFNSTIGVGGRMRTYTTQEVEGYYQQNTPSQFVLMEQKASAIGFWIDYYYFDTKMSLLSIQIAAGLDVDMTTVDLTATQGDDNTSENNPIASGTSKATTLSLRNLINIYMDFDGFGIGTMMNFLIPVAGTPTFSGSVDDPNASNLGVEPVSDLETSLDHKKASFGLEIMVHGYFAF